ncbi:MAG: hypothetical protein ACRDYC_10940 [Acidimicrobiales bacterium]
MIVINLEQRVTDRLAQQLKPILDERGIVVAEIADVDNVVRWRRAARRAGRLIGYPVRTWVSSDGTAVWAVIEQPVLPGEQAEAANRVATYIFGPRPFVQLVKRDV